MFYEKLDKEELEMIKNISKITMTNYGLTGDFFPNESWKILAMDLLLEIDRLEEELEDCKQDKEDNYVPRPMSDYTGDLEDDQY